MRHNTFNKSRGIALVVALMITLIIGVIALALGGMAFTGQRSENSFYSNEISNANALSGLNSTIAFLKQAVGSSLLSTVVVEDASSPISFGDNSTTYTIKGKTFSEANLVQYFKGVYKELDNNEHLIFGSGTTTSHFWYRTAAGWNTAAGQLCANCLVIGDAENPSAIVRIESRDFVPGSAAVGDAGYGLGYRYYRITALGRDPNSFAQTILQSNIALLSAQ